MKIYTKTGDDGTTGLLARGRVSKHDPRIEAYGTVDELNALLGLARASGLDPKADALVEHIQNDLFNVGAALADPDPSGKFHHAVGLEYSSRLEEAIDQMEAELPPLTRFILPGGTTTAATIHLARTVCRRAERRVVQLAELEARGVSAPLLVYLNRLSDALFVLARVVNHRAGVADVPWRGA